MSTATATSRCTEAYWADIRRLRAALSDAERVVVGAGAGLSTAAGFVYDGERFEKYFADFREKYGFTDMYSGSFYPFPTPEEHWAYWSRDIYVNRYMDPPKPVYHTVMDLVREKDYFVITTNVDHCFQKAGVDKSRLFYTQGDYGLLQCSGPCCRETWDNETLVRRMMARQRDMRVPAELVPKCPRCGRPLTMNLRADDTFVEDAGWDAAAERYAAFLEGCEGKKTLFLELGVGYNTPGIIKYPFWRMTARMPDAIYACINHSVACPPEIQDRAICLAGDIGDILNDLKSEKTSAAL